MVRRRLTWLPGPIIMLSKYTNWRAPMQPNVLDLVAPLLESGVHDLTEMTERLAPQLGYTPRRATLANYRSLFRRFGKAWREELREANKQWGRDNREAHTEASRKWAESYPARALLGQAKQRAKQRGLACELTEEYVASLLQPWLCSVTGIPLSIERSGCESLKNPWAPSLDRIDRQQGYVEGNVRVTCWLFNHMRGDYSDESVLLVARALVEASI